MIKVTFAEPGTPEWIKWKADGLAASAKARAAVAGGGRPNINDDLYKRMRLALYNAFHGKCAYCERKFVLDQSGDIDHFRPKGAVTDGTDKPVVRTKADGSVEPHPGYYWLAYSWTNLLPTCARCNRPQRLPDGRLVGKSTRFPVTGDYAWDPDQEGQEAPLFVHPIFDDPETHLGIDVSTGVIFHKTPRGQTCIAMLDLNREGLPEERRKRYTEIKGRLFNAFNGLMYEQPQLFLEELLLLNRYARGEEELSWAAKIAFEEYREKLRPLIQLFNP